MEVVSLSPLPVGSVVWQPRPGAWMLSFACKATFRLLPGRARLEEEQEPLYTTDRHWSDNPGWSLYAPTDVAPVRRGADVVLVGEAFAPGGQPVRSVMARLRVADVDKRIEVCGERLLGSDGVLTEGARFTRMPLLWERAAGGPDTINPVGIRADAKDAYGRRPLPNLLPPALALMGVDDPIEPVGFGPIAPAWPERRKKLGRAAAGWSERELPRQPLPQGMDVGYFNAAPWDQVADRLRDDERIVLEHLHPDHPHLATQLPGHHPRAFVARPGRAAQPAPVQIDLLWIRTDRGICTVTWRGQVALERPDEEGRVVVALEEPGQTLSWEEITGGAASGGAIADPETQDEPAPITQDPAEMTLPPQEIGPALLQGMLPSGDGARPRHAGASAMSGQAPPAHAQDRALPFASPASAAAPVRAEAASPRLAGTPFAPAAAPPSTPPAAAPPSVPPPPPAVLPPVAPVAPPTVVPPPAVVAPPALVPPPVVVAPIPPAAPAVPAAFAGGPGSTAAAPLAPPPLVRPQGPRTIGEAAAGPAAALHGGEGAGASAGALSASNAAAAASTPWSLPRESRASGIAAVAAALPQGAAEAREVLQLLWLDPESPPRFRRQPAWQRILEELDKRPLDKEHEDPSLARDPGEIEDRREVFEILVRGSALDAEGMEEALAGGIRSDGKLIPPLRIFAGDLVFPFDQVEALKATVAAVTPFVGNDEGLRAAVANAQELLKLPDLRGMPAVAESLMTRVAEAWGQGKRPTPQGYLESTTERALLEGRSYQRRKLLGGTHLRALAQSTGSQAMLPAYLPEALADQLPLYQRFRARAIVEVHPQVDQYETQPLCLRVLALARTANPPRRA